METLQRQKKLSFIDICHLNVKFTPLHLTLIAELVENLTDVMILKREARSRH